MINDPYQLLYIRDMRILQFIVVHVNGQMCCSVVAHQTVQFYGMDISGLYAVILRQQPQ